MPFELMVVLLITRYANFGQMLLFKDASRLCPAVLGHRPTLEYFPSEEQVSLLLHGRKYGSVQFQFCVI